MQECVVFIEVGFTKKQPCPAGDCRGCLVKLALVEKCVVTQALFTQGMVTITR